MVPLIHKIRKDHPKMSARKMYDKLRPDMMGRDKFEQLCFSQGLKVGCSRNYRKTTDSSGVRRFPNLIEGREVTAVNRVFVSDITYYEINSRYHYLTLIMDLYTREVVGFHAGKSLRTIETTIPAVNMLIRKRGMDELRESIFHSDGGGQYYSKEFTKLTSRVGMRNSMAREVYDNSHAERLNGIIKNDYLIPYNPQDETQLKAALARAVRNYNTGKPHSSLSGMTPETFRLENIGKPMYIKKITTTVEVENNSESYFPTSTVQHHQRLCKIE